MPKVARRRVIAAAPERVWSVISDPHHLPRWWPGATRVENVRGDPGRRRAHWTLVLETSAGRPVRADYRCIGATRRERYTWEQEVSGTPFERVLRAAVTEITLRPLPGATEVSLETRQSLRGLSRLGAPMMRRATGRILSEALSGLQSALVPGEAARPGV